MDLIRSYSEAEADFFRQLVVPEEDRHLFTSAPWRGEFRWFRSPNIIPMEKWRRPSVGSGDQRAALIGCGSD
jgi:hypothetical protein